MTGTYASPGSRSSSAILAGYVLLGACLLAVGADVRRVLVARDLRAGNVAVDALLGADQLVRLATVVLAAAALVAAVLLARWLTVVRRNGAALEVGAAPTARGTARAGVALLALALLAQLVAWTALGSAEDVVDRERIDLLRAGAGVLSAVACGGVVLAVSRVTAAQERRALEVGAPRAPSPSRPAPDTGATSGLQVVSEEQARRAESDR